MKNIKIAFIFMMLLAVMLTACDGAFGPGNITRQSMEAGYGRVIVNTGSLARTAFPDLTFDTVTYTFYDAADTDKTTPMSANQGAAPNEFELRLGSYFVVVSASKNSAVAATGESAVFAVEEGTPSTVTVRLTAASAILTGNGTFALTVTGPASSVITASLENLLESVSDISLTNFTGTAVTVPAGIYQLNVGLVHENKYAGAKEVIYIYSGFDTKFEREFVTADFTSYTVSFDANEATTGTAANAMSTYYFGTIILPDGTDLLKTNYAFLGWSETQSVSSTHAEFAVGASYQVKKNITLYAVWFDTTTVTELVTTLTEDSEWADFTAANEAITIVQELGTNVNTLIADYTAKINAKVAKTGLVGVVNDLASYPQDFGEDVDIILYHVGATANVTAADGWTIANTAINAIVDTTISYAIGNAGDKVDYTVRLVPVAQYDVTFGALAVGEINITDGTDTGINVTANRQVIGHLNNLVDGNQTSITLISGENILIEIDGAIFTPGAFTPVSKVYDVTVKLPPFFLTMPVDLGNFTVLNSTATAFAQTNTVQGWFIDRGNTNVTYGDPAAIFNPEVPQGNNGLHSMKAAWSLTGTNYNRMIRMGYRAAAAFADASTPDTTHMRFWVRSSHTNGQYTLVTRNQGSNTNRPTVFTIPSANEWHELLVVVNGNATQRNNINYISFQAAYNVATPDATLEIANVRLDSPQPYNITKGTIEQGGGTGSDISFPDTALEGSTVTVTVTPAEGYGLLSITSEPPVTFSMAGVNRTFTMPSSNIVISAVFHDDPWSGWTLLGDLIGDIGTRTINLSGSQWSANLCIFAITANSAISGGYGSFLPTNPPRFMPTTNRRWTAGREYALEVEFTSDKDIPNQLTMQLIDPANNYTGPTANPSGSAWWWHMSSESQIAVGGSITAGQPVSFTAYVTATHTSSADTDAGNVFTMSTLHPEAFVEQQTSISLACTKFRWYVRN